MQRFLRRHLARRAVLWLSVLGTVAAASVGLAPGAHAQVAAPSVAAAVNVLPGGYDVFAVGGDGFTPGAAVSIAVTDTATAAVLATIAIRAVASTPATAQALVDWPRQTRWNGQPPAPSLCHRPAWGSPTIQATRGRKPA